MKDEDVTFSLEIKQFTIMSPRSNKLRNKKDSLGRNSTLHFTAFLWPYRRPRREDCFLSRNASRD